MEQRLRINDAGPIGCFGGKTDGICPPSIDTSPARGGLPGSGRHRRLWRQHAGRTIG
jgi:hypothetical protein